MLVPCSSVSSNARQLWLVLGRVSVREWVRSESRGCFVQPNMRLLKQVQEQLAKLQAELGELVVEGSAGGGAVRVEVNGLRQVQRVRLDPGVVEAGDVELLEDLIAAAVNDALRRVEEAVNAKVGALAGGLGLPFPGGL